MSSLVIIGDFRMLCRELDARRIDVVISRLYGSPSEEFSAEILFEDPLVVVAGPNNPLTRRRKIELSELLDEPWTLRPPDNTFGSVAMEAFRAAGLAPPRLTVATTSPVCAANCSQPAATSRCSLAFRSYCRAGTPRSGSCR
jgi:DNA-binding transcriptional LysR family regulator